MPLPFNFQNGGYVRPIAHQTYKDRLDESLGMRHGPERDFTQSLADRRDESIGASLGRYGEPGAPVVTPPVVSPTPVASPTTTVNFPQFGGSYDYYRDPTITASTYGEPGIPSAPPVPPPSAPPVPSPSAPVSVPALPERVWREGQEGKLGTEDSMMAIIQYWTDWKNEPTSPAYGLTMDEFYNTYYPQPVSSDPNAAVAAAVGGGSPQLGAGRAEPGGASSHPRSADEIIADAVAAAVGGGTTGTGTAPVDAGGFPANPYVGQVYIDANHVTWTFAQGQWNRVDLASEETGTGTGMGTGTGTGMGTGMGTGTGTGTGMGAGAGAGMGAGAGAGAGA